MTQRERVTIELAALGLPFQLGMLYDCRSDSLIPGLTLWELKALQTDLNVQSQPNTEFHIIASDSIETKASALNVNGSLRASFLGGLIQVKGSAKYLSDTKRSKQQARVTLQYQTTTRFEQLTMSHLGRQNVTHPYVFDQGTATHVVTAVLYGAQAFFVFDQEVSSSENVQDIQGNLEVIVKIIPGIAIEGQASLKMTDEQKSNSQKFNCTFYGDFSLENNPTTFQDAINIYRTLPKLLGRDGEHTVPMRVWLYPLNKLDSKAAQLVRDISVGLVNRSQSVLEQLNEAVMRCNDMMRDSVIVQFPEIGNRIMKFREMCLEHKLVFQKTLARVLPSIRGGGVEEGLLVDILKNKEQSPFKHQSLIKWLDDQEREMNVVKSYLSILKDIHVVKSRSDLDREILDSQTEYVVCFTFTSLHQEDFYLSEANSYLQSHTAEKMQIPNPADQVSTEHHTQQWFNSVSVSQKMRERSCLFLDFSTANRARGKTKFIVASVQDDSNVGASIYLYERGFVVSHCFEPPSQPERPVVSGTTHDSVTLQFQPPRYGAGEIVGYRVEYRATQQEEWTTVDTSDTSKSFTISRLQPHQEYHFQYRAVTKAGVSMVSESYSVTTLPTSPPGKPLTLQVYWYDATFTWNKPTEIGAGVDLVQYRIEYREENTVTSSTENGLWEEIRTTDSKCRYTLEGLKPKTSYRVRVSAVCGEGGSSEPSDEVLIKTENEPTRLAEKLRRESTLTANGNPSIYTLPLKKKKLDKDGHRVKCSFGKPTTTHSARTIMVLGATGAGKTTLINGMINYILGVEWEDNFRYKLIDEGTGRSQAESQTSSIAAYELHHRKGFQIDYSLTIIDTPGFGDTRGITRDKLITDQIREFFTSPDGIDQIDAVCFVAQASLARLTHAQKYVFDSILSIFGKDIAENIQILVTFADGQVPPILEAINVAEVPCPKDKKGFPVHFKFNNSAIFAQSLASGNSANKRSSDDSEDEEENDNFDAMFWKMGSNSMKKFFRALNKMEAKSLLLTKEVLVERQQLEAAIAGLQPQITAGLTKLEEIRKTKQALNQHQVDLDANKDFEYDIEFIIPVQINISGSGSYITNCQKCRFTCHYPCGIPNDDGKRGCAAMGRNGRCTVCPGNCIWNDHFNQKYRFEYETRKEKRTYSELKEKYEKASGEKMTQQNIMEKLQQEFDDVQDVVLELIEKSSQSILRLEEIALRPNPLSTPVYIDLLIQSEKEEAKPGFMERIQSLNEVKKQAQLIAKVSGKEELFPEEWKEYQAVKKRQKERKGLKGMVSAVCQWITQKTN
ncbi:uncharacterized protein LOC119976518 [Scyliorhinus canicula]|uniref:uncharacterized protein LOC119976518 n=1 Tax=Scyliorhinus canicula TaxID=7830 RepID=UPI0018F75021|nr:uncharacterized protein LOC119976518 [Scyliorhinus canicula]XP_038672992.1 uncharacterized protein LOC119976518 [Scyliorhinus canicula]